jgi:hypothetical protein
MSRRSAERAEHLAERFPLRLNLEPDAALGVVEMTEGRIPQPPSPYATLRQAPLCNGGALLFRDGIGIIWSRQKPTHSEWAAAELQNQYGVA